MLIIVAIAILSNLAQFGFLAVPLALKFEKIDPIAGAKNLFSLKKVLEYLKLSAKLIIIFLVMCVLFVVNYDLILSMMNSSLRESLSSIFLLLMYFLVTVLIIIAIFALIDFYFIRYYYLQKLKMSKQEIKDEHKQSEGDPLVKGRIRAIQRKMAQTSILASVKTATVLVTNPTHYAVALKYGGGKEETPMVVAKGVEFMALKMREIASEFDIPIVENPPLARALYAQVEEEQVIPIELFEQVRAVLEKIGALDKLKGNTN
jgi:flagellar biosynthetic protein FlhB